MTIVAMSELRTHLPSFLKKVRRGEEICVTSRGETVAYLVPPHYQGPQKARAALRRLQKKCRVGDVISPLNEPWEALS